MLMYSSGDTVKGFFQVDEGKIEWLFESNELLLHLTSYEDSLSSATS